MRFPSDPPKGNLSSLERKLNNFRLDAAVERVDPADGERSSMTAGTGRARVEVDHIVMGFYFRCMGMPADNHLNPGRLWIQVYAMEVVDDVAFQRMDRRVATFLLERSQIKGTIRITHQEIANEIGSSREVISRILEDFSSRGLVSLSRGEIQILDPDAMKLYAAM
jgi:hypothetical protein